MTSDELSRPAPRPPYSVLGTERARGGLPARLAGGAGVVPGRAGSGRVKAARHRRRRLHRLRLRARAARGAPGRRDRGARQAHLRRPAREPGGGRGPDHVRRGRDRGPATRCAEAMDGCDLVVNFAAESHVDRSIAGQDPFAVTHVIGTGVLLDAARELGVQRYLQVSTDEVYGSIESRLVHRGVAAQPVLAVLGHEGGRRPARPGPRAHPRDRGRHLPRIEQLRAAPVPREADPALRAERAARRPAPGLRRRPPGAQLALRGGLRARDRPGAARGRARARSTTSAGPTRRRTSDVVERILELTGRDRSLIEHVEDRKGHDRRYSLSSDKVRALGWEPRVGFSEGLERTVEWYRENEWWWEPDPLGRVPRVLRAPVRPAARMTPALELRSLTKRYDDGTLALENFDLEIPAGSFFGLLGPERRRQDHRDQRGLQPDPDHERRGARLRPARTHARRRGATSAWRSRT